MNTKHKKQALVFIGLILFLNVLDVYNTLHIISLGGIEANPFMDYFMQKSVALFIFMKFLITSVGLYILYKFKKSYIVYILVIYMILIIYQFGLIFYLTSF